MNADMPKTMRAFAIDRLGDSGRLIERPTPIAGDDEVLIKVHAAGINPLDLKIRDGGKVIPDLSFPHILGQDCAGVVVQTGCGVTTLGIGSEVFGALWLAGTCAEYVCVPASRSTIALKPRSIDFIHAAALPTPALAAYAAIQAVSLDCGQTLLMNGATGSVGSLVIQMARILSAQVIATARPDSADAVRRLGATEVIDYTTTDLVAAVRSSHPDGIDALIDVVSNKETLQHVAGVLQRGGRLASTVHAADQAAVVLRGINAVNVDVFGAHGNLNEIARLVDDNRLTVPVDRTYPLEAASEVLSNAGRVRGKVVFTMF